LTADPTDTVAAVAHFDVTLLTVCERIERHVPVAALRSLKPHAILILLQRPTRARSVCAAPRLRKTPGAPQVLSDGRMRAKAEP
jgi:hypothetical protein